MALNIEWSEEARADIRRPDKPTARRIFDAVLPPPKRAKATSSSCRGNMLASSACALATTGCFFPKRAARFVFTSCAIARKPTAETAFQVFADD